MTVVIFGSINIDLVVQVARLPLRGETVIGNNFFTTAGGRGANQAVALAKLGIPVHLVGLVGGDTFGQTLLENLRQAGVNIDAVATNPNTYTGVSSIVVDQRGDNAIACAAGANSQVGEAEIKRFTDLLADAKVVILDLGLPLSSIIAAARVAHNNGCIVILDPAPARADLPSNLYPLIDFITPNKLEASQLVGFTVDGLTTGKKAASLLQEWGVKNVIITLGKEGALYATAQETAILPAIPVQVVDTVAAGDAFNGALAAALSKDKSIKEAVQWGNVAGALTVTKHGSQASLPDWETFTVFLSDYQLKSRY